MRKEVLLSTVLAIGVVAGALWIADQSMQRKSPSNSGHVKTEGDAVLHGQQIQPGENAASDAADDSPKEPVPLHASKTSNGISKCIVNGKTVYSNEGCPDGVEGRMVVLHDSRGIVSPPKENLAELTAKRKTAELASAARVQQVTVQQKSSGSECAELEKRIVTLDAMARQPQPISMQDWIREERKAVRDRQFAVHC